MDVYNYGHHRGEELELSFAEIPKEWLFDTYRRITGAIIGAISFPCPNSYSGLEKLIFKVGVYSGFKHGTRN